MTSRHFLPGPLNAHVGTVNAPLIPPFDVLDPLGRRRRVQLASPADTVADLARALGEPTAAGLMINGRTAAPHQRLVMIESLVEGSQMGRPGEPTACDPGSAAQPSIPDVEAPLEFAVVTGPSCRAWSPLPVGRHGIGRSPHATVRLTDPHVEAHHAMVDVRDDGGVRFTQLTGRIPVRVDRSGDGVDDIEVFDVGSSRVELRTRRPDRSAPHLRHTGGSLGPSSTDPWHREVRRGPLPVAEASDRPLEVPAPAPTVDLPAATALIGAGVAAVGAVVIAGLVGQTMFAVFALVGAIASVVTWLVGVVAACRRRRRVAATSRAETHAFVGALRSRREQAVERHRAKHPDIVDVLGELRAGHERIWRRRPSTGELSAVIGRGSWTEPPTIEGTCERPLSPEIMAAVELASRLDDVAIPILLARDGSIAFHGDVEMVRSVLRSIVVQLATLVGPADLRMVVVSATPEVWSWVAWLPHVRGGPSGSTVLASAQVELLAELETGPVCADPTSPDPGGGRRIVVVVDDPSLLSVRTGPLRRFMTATKATTLVAVDPHSSVPAVCRRTLLLGSTGGAEWIGAANDGTANDGTAHDGAPVERLRVAGIDEHTAREAALVLAPLVDPEDVDWSSSRLPSELTFAALDPIAIDPTADDLARRWRAAGPDPALSAPIGLSADGVVEVDLVRDGPHALIAGTTGSGKSELLRTLVVSMASRVSPEHLTFLLIDYKGGSTFDCCVDLPHTVGVVTDLDHGLAERALVSLDAELGRRERAFRSVRVGDLSEYRAYGAAEPIPRLVVVIDEFATLATDLPDFLAALVGVAQRGRSLGVHLVLATQRPGGVINDDIRANTNLRLALRVSDRAEARDVVGDDAPSQFRRSQPGRAAIRLGHDELIVFQAARCTAMVAPSVRRLRVSTVGDSPAVKAAERSHVETGRTGVTELSAAVAAIRRAAAANATSEPRRPWLDPLPSVLDHGDVDGVVRSHAAPGEGCGSAAPHDAVGVVDDPANQTRRPLRWDVGTGNLMLVGALGSGVTSTLVSLVAALCRTSTPDRCHLYVIDGAGDHMLDGLSSIAHCGAVVRVGEHERIDRLLVRLAAEIDRRSTAPDTGGGVRIVLVIDGLGELRRSLDSIDRLESPAILDRILDAGPSVGVVSCVTTDGAAGGTAVPVSERWVFRVDEPAIARAAGLRGSVVAAGPPGRLRIMSSGLEAQVAAVADGLAWLPSWAAGVGPDDVGVLVERVDPATLPNSRVVPTPGRRIRQLMVGIGADDLAPTALVLADGDHIFVGGAGRTGKSTALEQLESAWAGIEGPASVVRWTQPCVEEIRRRATDGDDSALLLVIDDADRVGDSGGLLAEILRGDHPRVTIAAAARVEAVRSAYGHWTREVTRSRCGIVLTSPGEIDGELLGATLPRRMPIRPRPGLAWVIDGHGHRLVQVAGRMPP